MRIGSQDCIVGASRDRGKKLQSRIGLPRREWRPTDPAGPDLDLLGRRPMRCAARSRRSVLVATWPRPGASWQGPRPDPPRGRSVLDRPRQVPKASPVKRGWVVSSRPTGTRSGGADEVGGAPRRIDRLGADARIPDGQGSRRRIQVLGKKATAARDRAHARSSVEMRFVHFSRCTPPRGV